MHKHISITIGILLFAGIPVFSQPQLAPDNIDEIVSAMTLEEKATLVVGSGWGARIAGITGGLTTLVPGAAGATQPIYRLGIPATVLADGPAGLRINPTRRKTKDKFYCTGFPIGENLSSTWDVAAVREVTAAMGNEVLEYGVDVLLGPGMNLHRNPLCGRNFEYYSEDPVLSGKIAAAYVQGLQSSGVGASVKHFAGNTQETNRTGNNIIVGERALRELYLKNFEISVKEGKPWTVMSSYNMINGPYTQQDRSLLTDILRTDWGYRGMVVTDWTEVRDIKAQIHAGNDLMEPGEAVQKQGVIDAINDGSLTMEDLDTCVKRILEYVVKTPRFKGYKFSDTPDLKSHAEVTRRIGAEGMVLLKNKDNVLPLKGTEKVALFGVTSYESIAGGTGSGNVNKPYVVNISEGLASAGFNVDKGNAEYYQKYVEWARLDATNAPKKVVLLGSGVLSEMPLVPSYIDKKAQANDMAVITIGRNSGEGNDRVIPEDFQLSAAEHALIEDVCNSFHKAGKKVLVVLNIGGVIESVSWKSLPDAILLAWQPGQEVGNAVADVLSGKVNPSGKLPMTFPMAYFDHPSSYNFPYEYDGDPFFANRAEVKQKNVHYTMFEEGIWVGYRYFDTFGQEVSYPFGFGLSYTDFSYSKPVVKANADGFTATITVTNTGPVAGKESVQLYVSAPEGGLVKPAKELKAFAKTGLLSPGESQTLTFQVSAYEMASFNEYSHRWETASGTYTVYFAASVNDIRAEKSFSSKNLRTWNVTAGACAPENSIDSAPVNFPHR